METFPVHPMVAAFIALPLERNSGDAQIPLKKKKGNIVMQSGFVKTKSGKWQTFGLPEGMAGRRVFLYLFSEFYQDANVIIRLNRNKREYAKTFGYRASKSRVLHPVFMNFSRMAVMTIKFINKENNDRTYYPKFTEDYDRIISLEKEDKCQDYFNGISCNPTFLFRMGFPVDFRHVIGTNKKSEFWNVYVFLIDVLPRIKKGTNKKISWELMHDVFYRRYKTLANFKFNFEKKLSEVFKIYPQAKGKVDPDSDKHHLILKYAPPPIEPITSTPNEPLQSESTPFYDGREIELNPHYEAQVKELCQPVAEFTTEKILFIRRIIIGIKETPYLFIDAKKPDVNVPKSYADEKGYIVLSISDKACRNLHVESEFLHFSVTFNKEKVDVIVPATAILAIYSKESLRGVKVTRLQMNKIRPLI